MVTVLLTTIQMFSRTVFPMIPKDSDRMPFPIVVITRNPIDS